MKLKYFCGHEIEATEEEAKDSGYVEYITSLKCEHCRKPEKSRLREAMSALAELHEENGEKWNPLTRTWNKS